MDDTILKVAIAAFMHDIGKFADRTALKVTDEFINNHADLYQPFFQKRHTHPHAVYTAAFIEYMKDTLPEEFNRAGWGAGDALINLAAGHHRPETPLQWVVAMADRISSGWDRDAFDLDYNYQVPWKDYKRTRLYPLFEQLRVLADKSVQAFEHFLYCYPLQELSPRNIFPGLIAEVAPGSPQVAEGEYQALFEDFRQALGELLHRKESLEMWFEHFDSLMMVYTSAIPAARAGKVLPDVSLYDHSRTTAALAAAIYAYHRDKDSLTVGAIRNYTDNKFLIITGDFYGIQDFIFSGYGAARKYRSKLMRGRSFAVSLFSELAACMVYRELGLPFSSVVLNAAGKFTIMAGNTPEAKGVIQRVEDQLNDWLVKVSCGESALGLSYKEASPQDFVGGNFANLWQHLVQEMERKKFARINLGKHAGPIGWYLDSFNNDLAHPLCPLCGKRPSSLEAENTPYIAEVQSACKVCRDHVFLGTKLVKEDRLAVTTTDAGIKGTDNQLLEPIFGRFQIAFLKGALKEMARGGQLLKCWDLAIDPSGKVAHGVAAKFISGYVPTYDEADRYDKRILAGDGSKAGEVGEAKTLEHIAAMARIPADRPGVFHGLEALGILKADVDYLGLLLACGLPEKSFTISRLATLSRQINFYFSLYLPFLLKTDGRFRNCYTVFAGGDDLFLMGPWNGINDLARLLAGTFADYVCRNREIHFSAGISLQKSHTPLDHLAGSAEGALKQSKDGGRNCLTLFGETITWDEAAKLDSIKGTLGQWLDQKWINNAMLYRLNQLIQMAGEEKRLVSGNEIHLDDLACTKWRALLAYFTERNVGKELKKDEREGVIRQVASSTAHWLEIYGSKLKIPLWELLYDRR